MMKKIYLALFLALAIATACNKPQEGFVVKGVIKNAAGEKLILNEVKTRSVELLDSIVLDASGKFEFTGKNSSLKFYQLQIDPRNSVLLLVDSLDVIEIDADKNDFVASYKVDGNEDSKLLAQLEKRIRVSQNKIDSLGVIYNANRENPNVDSVKQVLDAKFLAIMEGQKAFTKDFLNKNSGSLSSLLAISQQVAPRAPVLNMDTDMEIFEKVATDLLKNYPENEDVKGLKDYLDQLKNPKEEVAGVNIGDVAPEITLPTPEGKKLSLSSLRGNYVLLDFWAAWCRPCRAENPNLVTNYAKYNKKGFQIFQVSLDKTAEEWEAAIEKDKLTWNHVSDLKFWNSDAAALYSVRSIPANYLLDPEGKIVARNLRGPALSQKLQEIYGF